MSRFNLFKLFAKRPHPDDQPTVYTIVGWSYSCKLYVVYRTLCWFDAKHGVHERSSWQLGPSWQHNHIDHYLRCLDAIAASTPKIDLLKV